ncbi:hypothetical protein [Autumnicola edwardsiae]|uniref:Lipoprotein n=1 Tax=Autumnicola edwardsiae TaxID=3075594 RepID=A0ABU3CSQ4_9FLAO|nr:hypothetical protein [Zunongwangia sp. F297]MDT0649257.1 hypothetical protein [Zunongwangia sp. F297]
MKKLTLLLVCAVTLWSCDTDDDGPNILFEHAQITDYDFPEFFEAGETYDIELTYELPSACHSYYTVNVSEEQVSDGLNIYLGVYTSFDPDLAVCDEEDEDLTRDRTIEDLRIPTTADEGDIYTFFLLSGIDEDGEAEYIEVEIPVGAPEDEDDDTEDDTDGEDSSDESSN